MVSLFFCVTTTYLYVLTCIMSPRSPRRLGESSGSSIRGAGPGRGFFTKSTGPQCDFIIESGLQQVSTAGVHSLSQPHPSAPEAWDLPLPEAQPPRLPVALTVRNLVSFPCCCV